MLDVGDNTDNPPRIVLAPQQQALSDCRLAVEGLPHKRFVDDDDPRGAGPVQPGEDTTATKA